ncbi:dipeptide/oligopeptide/nickel ABC transporter permease/ATP-binding protein [Streptomyces phaeoluteigriseus]|uniref:Dipeptide/oligopeptide/nickel ABC transporter permease/ATP-binding protein n=1 Tax=Streptomyces phaeoluteigriseus TaxID=114686 RepID=A0ABY4ZD35_9ACTN|nr:dipeptide/oligopeptide/nickel ABC transporter permease/ATP-binding protein [Streptomyces phaeoluteigriseus]USQ86901.1 dipeptide/oligopeptide/nickel ABC transporter permease/ATP-binding protein [Streptomyces phaeoluteigriseus]
MTHPPRRKSSFLTPTAVTALVMLAVLVTVAVVGPALWGAAAERPDPSRVLRGPSAAHPSGTDHLGRDLLARVLAGTRSSLLLALAAALLGGAVGTGLGAVTAVVGRRARAVLTRLIHLLLAFPALLVSVFCAVVLGAGARGAVLATAVAMVPGFARIAQTLAAGVAERDFVRAARLLGLSRRRLLIRHVLANIAEPLVLQTTVAAGAALVALSGLSFLGLGVQAPDYDWGVLLGQGLGRVHTDPLPALAPGIAIVFAGLTFQLLGETLAATVARRDRGRERGAHHVAAAASPSPRGSTTAADHVLYVENLTVSIDTPHGVVTPVDGVTLAVGKGELVGMVGESGSGKSLTALAVADLLPARATRGRSAHAFLGRDLDALTPRERDRLLARDLAVVFQNPASAFNPALSLGTQLTEAARAHLGLSRAEATERAVVALRRVGLPASPRLLRSRPHQLSGGQRQRAMIASALVTRPRLIIADEPTTALDVTLQRQITDLLAAIRADTGSAILFISHDLAVVSHLCDRVLVMYAGTVVEELPAAHLAEKARHPYTRELVAALASTAAGPERRPRIVRDSPPDAPTGSTGCPCLARCPYSRARCAAERPVLTAPPGTAPAHRVACWYPVPAVPVARAEGAPTV